MGCRDIDEFARSDDLRAFPVGGEMLLISGNQVVSTGSICAFDEDVVVRVASDGKLSRWRDGMAMILDELNELLPRPFANPELRSSQYIRILLEDRS